MLRRDLKHGDIFQFADSLGLPPKIVDDGFALLNPDGLGVSRTCISARLNDEVVLSTHVELKLDPISPPHYQNLTPEPIDVIDSWGLSKDYYLASALAYIARAGHKKEANETADEASARDLRKAVRFLTRKIAQLEGRAGTWS